MNDLHVPVNEEILIDLKSMDVLHSFFLPNMRVKQDAVPGMRIPVWFRAIETGTLRPGLRRAVRLGALQDEGPADGRVARRRSTRWLDQKSHARDDQAGHAGQKPALPRRQEESRMSTHYRRFPRPRRCMPTRTAHGHAASFLQHLRLFPRPQGDRHSVPVLHAAVVPGRRPAGPGRALAGGLALVADADHRPMLFSAEGGQISPEFYTMLFTMHATVMIFFVIIPILAGAFGNFLIPLMIGADDMAFPTLNMLSYWFMWPAFICIGCSFFVAGGAAGSRLDVLSPALVVHRRAPAANGPDAVADRADLRRHLVDDGLGQLHDHHHPDARARHDDVPPADDDLGHVHHRHPAGLRPAGAHRRRLHAVASTALIGTGFFMPEGLVVNNADAGRRRRAAAAVAALVLVLFASGRVHHDPAGDGHGLRHDQSASPASRSSATSRWSIRSPASPGWASSCGDTTCSSRA